MSDSLAVVKRDSSGSRAAARLRREGNIPLVLYGHGEANLSLFASRAALLAVVRHGGRVVDLTGAVSEKAFLRDLQWDVYGGEILHADLTRVSAGEKVEVKVKVELKGEAPGVKDGGVLEHVLHEIEVECPVTEIPEKFILRIGSLGLEDALLANQIELPKDVTLLTPGDLVVVHCVKPKEESDEEPIATGAEPEVIKRKTDEDEAGDE